MKNKPYIPLVAGFMFALFACSQSTVKLGGIPLSVQVQSVNNDHLSSKRCESGSEKSETFVKKTQCEAQK